MLVFFFRETSSIGFSCLAHTKTVLQFWWKSIKYQEFLLISPTEHQIKVSKNFKITGCCMVHIFPLTQYINEGEKQWVLIVKWLLCKYWRPSITVRRPMAHSSKMLSAVASAVCWMPERKQTHPGDCSRSHYSAPGRPKTLLGRKQLAAPLQELPW